MPPNDSPQDKGALLAFALSMVAKAEQLPQGTPERKDAIKAAQNALQYARSLPESPQVGKGLSKPSSPHN